MTWIVSNNKTAESLIGVIEIRISASEHLFLYGGFHSTQGMSFMNHSISRW